MGRRNQLPAGWQEIAYLASRFRWGGHAAELCLSLRQCGHPESCGDTTVQAAVRGHSARWTAKSRWIRGYWPDPGWLIQVE